MAIAGKVAIVPKGEWDSVATYERLDTVSYNNGLYIAKKHSIGVTPVDGDTWMLSVKSVDTVEFEKIIDGTTVVGKATNATTADTLNSETADLENIKTTFTEATTRTNINSKETLGTIFGKIRKWFTDLKSVAFSGSYNDLTDKPTIPSVGNGTITVTQNGTTKGTFTTNQSGDTTIELTDNNTTYSEATTSTPGLMSATDKTKLNGIATGANNYSLPSATSSTLGGVKTTDSSAVTNSTGLALAATEKNASISGTLANQISALNSNLNSLISDLGDVRTVYSESYYKAQEKTFNNMNDTFAIGDRKVAYLIIGVSHVAVAENNSSVYILSGLHNYIGVQEIMKGYHGPEVSASDDILKIKFYNSAGGGYTIIRLLGL